MKLQFTIRDWLWLTTVIALLIVSNAQRLMSDAQREEIGSFRSLAECYRQQYLSVREELPRYRGGVVVFPGVVLNTKEGHYRYGGDVRRWAQEWVDARTEEWPQE